MMVVMTVPAVMPAKVVPWPPEACVGIAMTVRPIVVGLVVNARGVIRPGFDIDRCGLVVVVALDDAGAFDNARGRVFVATKVC